MRLLPVLLSAACAATLVSASGDAHALDLPKLFKKPLRLDVTEVSIVSQRFLARDDNKPQDFGWGQWINRLNASLVWERLTAGVRLDSALYWNRPIDQPDSEVPKNPGLERDDTGRYRNSIYPAKLFITYNAPGVEITLGDAYVQFTRGLVLSMRKLDDLGIDNTIRGAKIAITKGPFAVTVVGGYANPSRVDEATGYSLFLPKPTPGDPRSPQPVFGSDHIIGAEIQGGRGTPVVVTAAIANVTRCAPYEYFPSGAIKQDGTFFAEFGHCSDDVDPGQPAPTPTWLSGQNGFNRAARYVTNLSQSIEFPKIGKFGTLYIAGVIQQRSFVDSNQNDTGSALYASYSGNYGPVTNTLEIKSYRNFYPVQAAVDTTRVSAFEPIAYSQPPTGEVLTQDSAFGNFNACVDGGRLRTDIRMSKRLLTYFQAIYAHSRTELVAGRCDTAGSQVGGSAKTDPASLENFMWDGLGGIQYEFDGAKSYLYSTIGVRSDAKGTGESYYHQGELTYTFSKYLGKQVSLEFLGRHRIRYYETDNIRDPDGNGPAQERPVPWAEGENYTAIKIAPKWVFSQGIEYTSRLGYSSLYINGSILYRFTKDSNIRIFAGQQRGGLRCVSGVCRVFPAFEGARLELTVRF